MRLTTAETRLIKQIILGYRPQAKVYIFGSQVDEKARGGDIDVLVLDNVKVDFKTKLEILTDLNLEICEQKYDLVSYSFDDNEPFKKHILQSAILL